jgi:hypothetical protein
MAVADDLRALYAEALAAKFTEPVYRYDRKTGREWVENPEPADRVGESLLVRFIAPDGGPAFRAVTCEEAAEVCADVRDAELEQLRARVAELEATPVDWDAQRRRADQAEAAIARVRRLCDLTIAVSIRAGAIDQARDTLAALDGEVSRD